MADADFAWPRDCQAAVTISFDDARASQLDVGLPLLERMGAPAVFYVSLKNLEGRVDEWREVVQLGHEIGNHTLTHPCSANFPFARKGPLEEQTLADMERELVVANDRIRDLLGLTPTTFAYPCGQKFVGRGAECHSYVPLVAKHFLAGRGFMDEWCNHPLHCDLAQLMGVWLDALTFDEVLERLRQARQDGGWLFLAGHDVGHAGRQTTLVETLQELSAYCADPRHGVWLDTAHAVASWILQHRL